MVDLASFERFKNHYFSAHFNTGSQFLAFISYYLLIVLVKYAFHVQNIQEFPINQH